MCLIHSLGDVSGLRVSVRKGWDFHVYLDVFVELVCDVLPWDPTAEVFVLHLLDPLDGVLGDCVEWAHHATIWEDVSLRLVSILSYRAMARSTHCEFVSECTQDSELGFAITSPLANWGR